MRRQLHLRAFGGALAIGILGIACLGRGGAGGQAVAAAEAAAGFYCFAWVHGPVFSTDCFRGKWACERARAALRSGDKAPCEPQQGAVCTVLSRKGQRGEELCFGDAGACERRRALAQGAGLLAAPCTSR